MAPKDNFKIGTFEAKAESQFLLPKSNFEIATFGAETEPQFWPQPKFQPVNIEIKRRQNQGPEIILKSFNIN